MEQDKRMRQAVFLIKTSDRKGVLAGISGFFYQQNLNILQCRQYTDVREDRYYMRISVELGPCPVTNFILFRDGKFVTHEIQSEKKFLALAGH